jgi:hypothetical protein
MIDVSDEVYADLVEPHKRQKTFSKLIVALLQGYISDPHIRAVVDDSFDDGRRTVVGSFEDSILDMEASLAKMGLITDSLHANANAGYSKFNSRAGEQASFINKGNFGFHTTPPENESLEKKVQDIEQTMQNGFTQIMQMLSGRYPAGQAPMGYGYPPMYPALSPAMLAQMGFGVVGESPAPVSDGSRGWSASGVAPKEATPVVTEATKPSVPEKVAPKEPVKKVDEPIIDDIFGSNNDSDDSSEVGDFLGSLMSSFGESL